MGAFLKGIALGILCFILVYSRSVVDGTVPGGKLYYCDSDKQCHSRAKCLFNLCTCQGWSYGDGKYKCEAYKPCNSLINRQRYGCKSAHSICLTRGTYRLTKTVCRCKDGYIGDPSKYCQAVSSASAIPLCKTDSDCGYDNCVSGRCRCPESSMGNSDNDCIYSESDCQGKGPCTKPGTICFQTALFKMRWTYQDLCMCKGKLVGDPYKTGCREPTRENLCKWYGESCPKNSQCKQHGGTFKCECAPGFLMNKWSECIDIDECKLPSKCASTSKCTNTQGSFTCKCQDGFIGDGIFCKRMPHQLKNIAVGRPTEMQSTEGKYYSEKAVDGNRNGNLQKGSCARTTKFKEPWWRVDLGNRVWVEKVLIANRDDCCHEELSNVEIRIGNKKESSQPSNPICRQDLQVPKEPWLYSCAEPMLGKYVYIRLLGKQPRVLTICEVEVYVDKTATLSYSKFLLPGLNGKFTKPTFVRKEGDKFVMKLGEGSKLKISRRKIIVDLPPKEESLKHGVPVYLPVNYDSFSKNATATCGRGENSEFLNGKFVSEIYAKMKYAVNVTNNVFGRRKFKNKLFQCSSLTDLRMRTGNICKLQVKCPNHSSCDSKHVSITFPPGSYQCVCDDGFSSSSKRPGNVVASGEECNAIVQSEPNLKYSRQNLALNSKTSSSPIDNFAGCKHKHCKETPALAKFAVDGFYDKCYRSVSTYNPWLMIHLDGTHPIVLIQIATSKEFNQKRVKVFIGHSGKRLGADNLCAVRDIPKSTLWNMGCKKIPLFGDVVKIQTSSQILALCEVEIYAEPYGNVAMGHAALGSPSLSVQEHPLTATDGKYLFGGPPCFKSKDKSKAYWTVDLGPENRVAMVFIYLQKEAVDLSEWGGMKDIDIFVGDTAPGFTTSSGNKKREDILCYHVSKPIIFGEYLECKETLKGRFVKIQASKPDVLLELCEVEVFPTRTVNLAGNRMGYSSSNQVIAARGTDHKMDEAFRSDHMETDPPWWSVDLLIKTKIHMVRIVTATDYKKSDFYGLELLVGEGLPADQKNRLVAKCKPTDEPVQVITLEKKTWTRFVTLMLNRKKSILSFREVEVYNGPLIDVDECKVPGICPESLKCVNLPISFTCECRDGYKPRAGNSTDCIDIDECLDAKSACPVKNSYCQNTVGSHNCICMPGYQPFYHGPKLASCRDIDECTNSSLYYCPTNNSKCFNEQGSYTCGCAEGYKKLSSSEFRNQDIKCIDADECKDGSALCHTNATCANTIGSYTCTCSFGTLGDGRVCQALDTCSDSKPCLPSKVCKPVRNLHFCFCDEGYEDAGKTCKDKDECALQEHSCGLNSRCSNTEGGYECSCNTGYKSATHDGRECKDINECEDAEKFCGTVAECQNTEGGYTCKCPTSGFAFDHKIMRCVDYDECDVPESPCARPNEVCNNIVGSYTCSCRNGYRYRQKNDTKVCEDIDECLDGQAECDSAAICKNTIGGYTCKCKEGYKETEDGKCEEECLHECGENSYCFNGRCYCSPGYVHDPVTRECFDPEALLDSSVSVQFSAIILTAAVLGYLVFEY